MVAAQCDDTREGLAFLRRARSAGVGGGLTHEDAVVALFDLMDGVGIVVAAPGVSDLLVHARGMSTDLVTGMSPQSRTVAQLSNGFASRGTL